MNVGGKRVFVIGDSHCSMLGRPLKAKLKAAGAKSVRINWKGGRSIHSYYKQGGNWRNRWEIKHHKPDVVLVILGTNHSGVPTKIQTRLFNRLRNIFQAAEAEVWAVGPPQMPRRYRSEMARTVGIMKGVFGLNRFLDLRPLTQDMKKRFRDRIHFNREGAHAVVEHIVTAFRVTSNKCSLKLPGTASLLGFGLLFIIDRRNKLAEEDK